MLTLFHVLSTSPSWLFGDILLHGHMHVVCVLIKKVCLLINVGTTFPKGREDVAGSAFQASSMYIV